MAKDALVGEWLSEEMRAAGAALLERLDAAEASVSGAFWLFDAENRSWKLVIVFPRADTEGPRSCYRRILAANESAGPDEEVISLNDVEVAGPKHRLYQSLRQAVGGGGEFRFSRNAIDGDYIEDAYIYRL